MSLKAAKMHIVIFWVMIARSLVGGCIHFQTIIQPPSSQNGVITHTLKVNG
jgi:hypothetical protein